MQPKILESYLLESLNYNSGYFIKKEKTLFQTQTKYQKLEILETNIFGRMLRLDNIFQTSEKDEFLYHEVLVHPSAISIGNPKKALVIGGGDGGTIEEILKYNTIQEVSIIELDKEVIDFSIKYLPSISNNAFSNPKLQLIIGDGMQYINSITEKMDMIVLDLTDPIGDSIHLYTMDFYKIIKEKLTPQGVLSLHIESPISSPEFFARIYQTLCNVFTNVQVMLNYVPIYGSLWGFALASETTQPDSITQEQIQNRIGLQKLKNLQFYNPHTHISLMSLPNYVKEILKQKVEPIRSDNPLEDVQKMHLQNAHICQFS